MLNQIRKWTVTRSVILSLGVLLIPFLLVAYASTVAAQDSPDDGSNNVATATPAPAPTATPEPPAPTATPEPPAPTATPEPPAPTDTPEPAPTDTPEPAPTDTPEPAPTDTPEPAPTATPEPAPTATPEPAPTDTPEPAPTATPEPAPTDTPEPAPTATPEPAPTATPEPAPTDTPEPAPTATPEPAPTDTPEPAPTATPEPAPTDTPEPTPTDTPEPAPTDTPEPQPTATPEPTPVDSLASDKAALQALYNATNGDNWKTNFWWDFSHELSSAWWGVKVENGRVTELNLSWNRLSGTIPPEIGDLTALTHLDLSSNQLSGTLPAELANLSNLTYLDLWANDLSGTIPAELGNLPSITYLGLSANALTGAIPAELGNLSTLESLYLGINDLTGTIPTELGNLSNLKTLSLSRNDLNGSIPAELGNLTNLNELYLSQAGLSGAIPEELADLSNLTELVLWHNALTGSIPAELGDLTGLTRLDLSGNALTGSVPAELGNLTNLTQLDLAANRLTGAIPAELANLVNLTNLDLAINNLSGLIPNEMENLVNLEKIGLASNRGDKVCMVSDNHALVSWYSGIPNRFPANTPICAAPSAPWYLAADDLGAASTIKLTWDDSYDISIDKWQSRWMSLNDLITTEGDLGDWNDIPGSDAYTTEQAITGLTGGELYLFQVRAVNFVGDGGASSVWATPLSTSVGDGNLARDKAALQALYNATDGDNWDNNDGWDFSTDPSSSWYGVTVQNGRVTSLVFHRNGLSGTIPADLGNLTELTRLYLEANDLSGTIPVELGNLPNLAELVLWGNDLTGTIPTELGNLTNLTQLELYANELTGTIPVELGNLSNLTQLELNGNKLTGAIPTELGNLTSLTRLELGKNKLSGPIPSELGNLTNLTYLSLWDSELSGTIPAELGNLTNLVHLSLWSTKLSGLIPDELANLTSLDFLGLPDKVCLLSDNTTLTNWYKGIHNRDSWNPPQCAAPSQPYYLAADDLQAAFTIKLSWVDAFDVTIDKWQSRWMKFDDLVAGSGFGDWKDIPGSDASTTEQIITGLDGGEIYYFQVRAVNFVGDGGFNGAEGTPLANPVNGGSLGGDKAALQALYHATDGGNWVANTGWDFSADPSSSWHGVTVANGRVTGLNLAGNGLTGSIPSDVLNLTQLTSLNLSDNELEGSIPVVLGDLSNLETLDLSQNDFGGQPPAALANLTNLTTIDISQTWACLPSDNPTLTNWYAGIANRQPDAIPACVAPSAPTAISADGGTEVGMVHLAWVNSYNGPIDKWQTRWKTDGDYNGWADVPNSDADTTEHNITGLAGGVVHTFQVRAVNTYGDGNAASATVSPPMDYDIDDDGLIEVSNLAQLNAIRWDLNGDGAVDHGTNAHGYLTAFDNSASDMGCSASACIGYELTADLDFDTNNDGRTDIAGDEYWNGGDGWEPIGSHVFGQALGFNAVFEGNDQTISNLFTKGTSADFLGLFGATEEASEIRNLGLVNVQVDGFLASYDGAGASGGLVGRHCGSIVDSYTTGSVRGASYAGGLVGRNCGSIASSHSSASVNGAFYVGGLTGSNFLAYSGRTGAITGSYATGSVTGTDNAGGLVGYNHFGEISASFATGTVTSGVQAGGLVGWNTSTVTSSFATGAVSGNINIGGLAGWNTGTITSSYAAGSVTGEDYVGGLVGTNRHYGVDGTIANSYATGLVTGDSLVGGLVGGESPGVVTDSYWDTQTSGQSTSVSGVGKTTSEMQSPTANTGIYSAWDENSWDFGKDYQYPALKADIDGDGRATVWEFGVQRPSVPVTAKPVKENNGNAITHREWFSISFSKVPGEDADIDGVGYRIAAKGEACHEWFGGSRVKLGESDGRATLTEDHGVYTMSFDRKTTWAFRNGNRVCVDVGFINSEGKGGPGRRWHAIEMPSERPRTKPIMEGDAIILDGAVALEFRTDPYDWARGAGYRIAREGNACHNWTGGRGPFRPGDEIDGATLDRDGDIWRLTLPVGDNETMRPNRKYCVDVSLYNDDDWAPNGRRWRFTTGN